MAATIRQIPLPSHPSVSATSNGATQDANDSFHTPRWDYSIGAIPKNDLPNNDVNEDGKVDDKFNYGNCITYHAIAHGNTVVGTLSQIPSNNSSIDSNDPIDSNDTTNNTIQWQSSFDDPVVTVASNADGSVIAAATKTHVSLLRGRDGTILATRQIAPDTTNSKTEVSCPGLVFVSRGNKRKMEDESESHGDNSTVYDSLIILCPMTESDGHRRNATVKNNNVIIISNIDGEQLNSPHMNQVRQAASHMSIDPLSLDSGDYVKCLSGVFVDQHTIRFFIANQDGMISVYDYDGLEKSSSLILEDLLEHLGMGTRNASQRDGMGKAWEWNENSGLNIDCHGGGPRQACPYYLLFAANMNDRDDKTTRICWVDSMTLTLVGCHSVPNDCGEDARTTNLTSLQPIESFMPDKCVSAAFVVSNTKIQVIQLVISSEEEDCGRHHFNNYANSMLLFTVNPYNSMRGVRGGDVRRIQLCSPPVDSNSDSTEIRCRFRFLIQTKSDENNACGEFSSDKQSKDGMVHYLLAKHQFEEAYGLINQTAGKKRKKDIISSPITKSFVAFCQFRHVLSKGDVSSEENVSAAKECLRRLASGAVTGGDSEVDSIIDAARFLLSWPKNTVPVSRGTNSIHKAIRVSIQEISLALNAMSMTMKGVANALNAYNSQRLQEMKAKIDDRHTAMKGLRFLTGLDRDKISNNDPYLEISSISDLINALVSQGAFKSVERFQKSDLGKHLAPDVYALAALNTPTNADPRAYVPWLCDIVIPSLSTGNPLLESIRIWCCKAADNFDEENIVCGLDSSISLLKAVSKATARLSVAENNAFVHNPQTNSDSDIALDKPDTPRDNASFFSSFDSKFSVRSTNTRPTILKIGMKGKEADNIMYSARKASFSTPMTPESISSSFFSSISPRTNESVVDNENEIAEYDNVEIKLTQALRLRNARCLGMERNSLTLANYSDEGEQFIVKELVKCVLSQVATKSEKHNIDLVNKIRAYAIDVGASFDDAVHQYAIELCDFNRNVPNALRKAEILSHWCSSSSVRCLIVLKMVQKARASVERPPDLNPLAMEAISWASDINVKAELEEATRLLAIDSLVRKYCGNGAQEFFQVHEQSHGLRLVQQVCRHIDVPSVLSDAMMLCDAFKYVSRVDTCVTIIQRTMLAPRMRHVNSATVNRAEQCASFLHDLYAKDDILAEKVGERVAVFCAQTLVDCRKIILKGSFVEDAKRQAMVASSTACAVLSIMHNNTTAIRSVGEKGNYAPSFLVEVSALLKEFQKVSVLQSGCSVFLTLEEMRTTSACKSVLLDLLKPCIELLATQNYSKDLNDESLRHQLKSAMAKARHWCAILGDTPSRVSQLWSWSIGDAASRLARSSGTHASLLLLQSSGVLDDRSYHSSCQSILAVVLSLCSRAFVEARKNLNSMQLDGDSSSLLIAMNSIAQASLLLREHVISFSPPSMLSPALSLCNLTELVCEVSIRSDLGVGERVEKYLNAMQNSMQKHHANPIRATNPLSGSLKDYSECLHRESLPTSPNLHPSWYIGDGLLLRPIEALSLSMTYCEMIINFESISPTESFSATNDSTMTTSDIFHPLESRGAHTMTLRLLSFSTAVVLSQICSLQMDSTPLLVTAESTLKKNESVLAERSLGGTESGITSGNIDSQLAILFLVQLPKESAFKIYQAALPSAMGRRDFNRILTLASIGAYCGIGTYSSGKTLPWNKQRRFIEQCKELCRNSKWWGVLSRHSVSFDPSIFTSSNDSANENLEKYCRDLIWNAATSVDVEIVLRLSSKFTHAYGLNKVFPQTSLIEFLLSSPKKMDTTRGSNCESDIRFDLIMTESAVRLCLSYLPVINQSKVLRKCLIDLERDPVASRDYDRHTLVLTLYSECLGKLVTRKETRVKALEAETLRVQRRFDVLALLSTTFESYPLEKRPEYSKMFEPLPLDPFSPPTKRKMCSVLGFEESGDVFDPLAPLHDILDHSGANSMAGALASLCSMVQLPPGYLHARSLIVRFRKLRGSSDALPKVESSVIPVIKKLVSPADKADLAWWCSSQYASGSVEQLHCLDLAHSNATTASEEIESLQGRVSNEDERAALDRVKRIDTARAILSDHILVDKVLEQNTSSDLVQKVYKSIIRKVQKTSAEKESYCPEHFVRELLIEGSLAAALASLDDCDGFTTFHFRSLAILVHDACKLLASRYTHIFVGRVARILARRWMIHGDDVSDSNVDYSSMKTTDLLANSDNKEKKLSDALLSDEGEITSDFVMDIAWTSDLEGVDAKYLIGNAHRNDENPGIIASEEPSALNAMSSLRESSEHICSRVALRIAFLICFAEGYHRNKESIYEEFGDENIHCNIMVDRSNAQTKSKGIKQSSPKDGCFEGHLALEHARELLGVVFAGQGSTVASTCGFLLDEYNSSDNTFLSGSVNSTVIEDARSKNKALSFAMRHRALRVASILCPHDVILRVILEEGYATDVCDDHLNKYAFGSFVAMEIEAMGLPLPHSDLIQLSEMHFPSFARTIWRNHGGGSYQGFTGRLHLILLELCVSDRDSIDWELLVLIFKELMRLELPRSLILASECVAKSDAFESAISQNRGDVILCVEDAVNTIVRLLGHEVRSNLSGGIEMNVPQCSSTVDRIATIVCSIHNNPLLIVSDFTDLAHQCSERGQREICKCFIEGASSISSHLVDPSVYSKALNIIRQYGEGYECIQRNLTALKTQQSKDSIYSEAIESFEMSFSNCVP